MKRRISALIGAFTLCATTMFAQFNTVTQSSYLYKVKHTNPLHGGIEKEASLESDTSHITDSIEPVASYSSSMPSLPQMSLPLKSIHITSAFGWRRDPFVRNKRSWHSGVDLRANYELVYSMLPGIVSKCGYDNRSGHYVVLSHGNISISYCHLSKILVAEGSPVYPGMPVARTGNSGRSTGPHLHIGGRLNGTRIDVTPLLMIIQSHL